MGNIFSLDIFSGDVLLAFGTTQPTMPTWAIILLCFFFALLGMAVAFLCHCLFPKFRHRHRNTARNRYLAQLPTLLILFLVFSLLAVAESRGHRRPKSKPHRYAKKAAKFSGGLLATSAAFLGMDQLASFLLENPDAATASIAVLGAILATAVLILLLLLLRFLHRLVRCRGQTVPNPPLTDFEMQTLRQLTQDPHSRSAVRA